MSTGDGYAVFSDTTQVSGLLDELRIMFEEADANNDKVLDFEEFTTLMSRFMPQADERDFKEIFDTMDTDNSGEIKYLELLETGFFTEFLEQGQSLMQNEYQRRMISRQVSEAVDFSESPGFEAMQEQIKRMEEKLQRLREYREEEGEPAKRRVEELTTQLDLSEETNKRQMLQIQELEDEVSALRFQNESLEENLESMKQIDRRRVAELDEVTQNGIAENQSVIADLKEQLVAEQDRSQSFLSKMTDLIKTNSACQNQISSLQNDNKRLRREAERVQFQQTKLQDRLTEMTAKFEAQCQQTQEWMQAAIDLESEIESQQQEQTSLASIPSTSVPNRHRRDMTMKIGSNLNLFATNLYRQESTASMSGSQSNLAFELGRQESAAQPEIRSRDRAQTNWGRLQSTLQVASAIKNVKPMRKRGMSQSYSPSPPPIDEAKLADSIVGELFPRISDAIDNVVEKVSTAVTDAVENEFATIKEESEEQERARHKRQSHNGSISFNQTRTPAPSIAELISPRGNDADVREEEMDFVDEEDGRSIADLEANIRSLRTWLEGSGLGKNQARDQVMNQILQEVSYIRDEVRTLQETKASSEDSAAFSDVTVHKRENATETFTEDFRETLIHDSEEMLRRVLGDFRKQPQTERDDWFWL